MKKDKCPSLNKQKNFYVSFMDPEMSLAALKLYLSRIFEQFKIIQLKKSEMFIL